MITICDTVHDPCTQVKDFRQCTAFPSLDVSLTAAVLLEPKHKLWFRVSGEPT